MTGGNPKIRHFNSHNDLVLGSYFSAYPSSYVKEIIKNSIKNNKSAKLSTFKTYTWDSNSLRSLIDFLKFITLLFP